jgi:FkbM family methyltransferase
MGKGPLISMDKLRRYCQKASLAIHHPSLIVRKLRQYHLRLTSFSLDPDLIQAYQNADSPVRAEMLKLAHTYYGPESVPPATLREATNFNQRLLFSSERLYRHGVRYDLGVREIGFKDLKVQCESSSVLESMIYLDGFYEELTVFKVYEAQLRRDDYVVDVGANVGVHALAMSRLVGENGKVFAYEPNSALVTRMQRNLQLNAVQNVAVRQTALGDLDGQIRFHDATGEFNQGLGRHDPKGDLTVPVIRLDEDLKTRRRAIALMKIDVEGMELRVVRGARQILERDRPAIVVEFNNPPWRLKELVTSIPFATRIYRIPNTYHETMRPIESQSDLFGFNNLLIIPAEV